MHQGMYKRHGDTAYFSGGALKALCMLLGLMLFCGSIGGVIVHQKLVSGDTEVALSRMALFKEKRMSFAGRELFEVSERKSRARLVKVLLSMQAHLRGEVALQARLRHSGVQLKQLLATHAESVKAMEHETNPYTHPDLLGVGLPLVKATAGFHAAVARVSDMAGRGLEQDAATARYRLGNATAQIMAELQSEAEQEAAEKAARGARARGADPLAAQWEKDAARQGKGGRARTGDERDVDSMIEAFEARLRAMRGPYLPAAKIEEGAALLARVHDEGTTDVALLERAFTRVVELMDEVGHAHDANLESQVFVEQFEELLHLSRFWPVRNEMMLHLQGWHAGKVTSTMLMLHIEKLIAADQLDVGWLDGGGSAAAQPAAKKKDDGAKAHAEAKIQEAVLGLGW